MNQEEVGKFIRYYQTGSTAQSAYIVCHGSYNDYGFTKNPTPASVYFYVFHSDTMYTVEIFQLIHYRDSISFDGDIERGYPERRQRQSSEKDRNVGITGYLPGIWQKTRIFVDEWASDRGSANTDLIMLPAGEGGLFSDAPNAYLDELFEAFAGRPYEVLHFCCCRSVKGEGKREEPPSTRPLYKSSMPYWGK